MFHLKLALVTKTCFVAYKNLNNFHFYGILSSVQILGEICKTTKLGSSGYGLLQCSSRGVLCRRGRAAASGAATRLATQLLAAVPRSDVLIRCQYNAARIKPRATVENFFFP